MNDKSTLSDIKSEPLDDEQHTTDVPFYRKESEEYVEELEKQLANNLTIQEIPTVAPIVVPASTKNVLSAHSDTIHATDTELKNVANLTSKLKKSAASNEELRKRLAASEAELAAMKEKYFTEKITLQSITKAKWKSAEQVEKESHEKDIAALQTSFKNLEKALTQKNDSLQHDVARLETGLKESLTNLVQMEKDLDASRSSVRLLTDNLIRAETALEENMQAKTSLEQLYSAAKYQCADLLQQMEILKRNEQSNLQQLHSLKDKVEQQSLLSLELPVLRSQHDATKNKLIKAEAKILQLESELMDHKKNALNVNIIKRQLQQAHDNQKNADSAMAVLVQKLATLEHVKEDAKGLKSALNQTEEERTFANNKIKRLKRRLSRKSECNNLLRTKWDKLTLFLRKLEEKAATGELLTRSDFDTVLHFVLNSPFTDVKSKTEDSNHYGGTDEPHDEIGDNITEIELSPSSAKDTIEKVVKKFKAVEITAKRYPSTSRSPTKSTVGTRRNAKVICSRKTKNVRMTCSNITCSSGSCLKSGLRNRKCGSMSPECGSTRKRSSVSSTRRSSSRSLSVETISRSPSPSRHYKRCRYRRSRSRSYTRFSKSYNRYSPFYYSSRSSSRELSSSRKSFSKKKSKHNRESSVERWKEGNSTRQNVSKRCDVEAAKSKNQTVVLGQCHSEMEKLADADRKRSDSSPEILIIDVEKNRQEVDASSLEEGEIENYLLTPEPQAETITEADWDALILSTTDNLGVDNLSPALAQVSLQPARVAQNPTNPEVDGTTLVDHSDRLGSHLSQEIEDVESSQDAYEVAGPSSSAIHTMTRTSEPGISRHSPEIIPLYVVPASNAIKNLHHSEYSQQARFLFMPPAEEDWDAESNASAFNGGDQATSATWNKHLSRGNYNNVNNLRIVVPPSRACRPRNRRKFSPYMLDNRVSATKIPIELNVRNNVPQQPLPGHSIVDEFMQQYTVSIIKEIPGYSEKHPVEALRDLCISKGWEAPKYTYHADTTKNPRTLEYFCKVFVNNVLHQPKYGSSVKQDAQTIAAIYCLQKLGVNP